MEKGNPKGCLLLVGIWLGATILLTFLFSSINKTGQGVGSIIAASVFLGILVTGVVFCFMMVIAATGVQKAIRRQQLEDKAAGISRFDSLLHIGGLNAPSNCRCSAILNKEGLTVTCSGNEFFLRLSKIKNVEYQFDVDEKTYLVINKRPGIAGGSRYGGNGDIIGTALATKTKRDVKGYAVISYEGTDGSFKTFVLKDEKPNVSRCEKLVKTLTPMIQIQTNKVEL